MMIDYSHDTSTASWVQFTNYVSFVKSEVSIIGCNSSLIGHSPLPGGRQITPQVNDDSSSLDHKRLLMLEACKEKNGKTLVDEDKKLSAAEDSGIGAERYFPVADDSPIISSHHDVNLTSSENTRNCGATSYEIQPQTLPDPDIDIFKMPEKKVSRRKYPSWRSRRKSNFNPEFSNETTLDEFSMLINKKPHDFSSQASKILAPSISDCPAQPSSSISKNSKGMILTNWIIKRLSKGRIRVEGEVVKGKYKGELWKTTAIMHRVNDQTIQTRSNSTYILDGYINKENTAKLGFSKSVINEFKNGFPENWVAILNLDKSTTNEVSGVSVKKENVLNDSDIFDLKLKCNLQEKSQVKQKMRLKNKKYIPPEIDSIKTTKEPLRKHKKSDTAEKNSLLAFKKPRQSKTFNGFNSSSIKSNICGDDILVEKLPESRRGRKIIPRLKWWENERVNTSISYIMQKDDSELTISKPSSLHNSDFNLLVDKDEGNKAEKSTRLDLLNNVKHRGVEVKNILKRKQSLCSSSEKPTKKSKNDNFGRKRMAKNLNDKCMKPAKLLSKSFNDVTSVKRSTSAKRKNMDSSSADTVNHNKRKKNFQRNKTLNNQHTLSEKTVKLNGNSTNDTSSSERPRRERKDAGFYHQSNFDIKFEKQIWRPKYSLNQSLNNKDNMNSTKHKKSNSKIKALDDITKTSKNTDAVKKSKEIKKKDKTKNLPERIISEKDFDDVKKADKENSINARKGSQKYRTQVLKMIDEHNKDYEDDMFENANISKNNEILNNMLQCDDEDYNIAGYATPVINPTLLSMRPEVNEKTPGCHSGITPNLLKSLNRTDMDSYHHQRQKWKKNGDSKKKNKLSATNEQTCSKPDPTLSSGMFDVFVVEKNHDEEVEGPEDYYFEDN